MIFAASGAYLGHMPHAPGTWGTLAGIPLVLLLAWCGPWLYLGLCAALALAAVWVSGRAIELYGRHDDPRIVIDEVVGLVVTMFGTAPTALTLVLGFALFRAFDIFKPWPCRTIDRKIDGGVGVVLDDVAAGVYAAAALHLIMRYGPI